MITVRIPSPAAIRAADDLDRIESRLLGFMGLALVDEDDLTDDDLDRLEVVLASVEAVRAERVRRTTPTSPPSLAPARRRIARTRRTVTAAARPVRPDGRYVLVGGGPGQPLVLDGPTRSRHPRYGGDRAVSGMTVDVTGGRIVGVTGRAWGIDIAPADAELGVADHDCVTVPNSADTTRTTLVTFDGGSACPNCNHTTPAAR